MPATGAVTFEFHIAKRGTMTEIMEARLRDMSPAFKVFITKWTQHNADKFRMGSGMEGMGIDFVPEPSWEGLTEAYHKRKQAQGFADHLMVRTGELRATMTNENRFVNETMADSAFFGAPLDPEDAIKVEGNWERRQVIFLDQKDMNTLRKTVVGYLEDGPDFQTMRQAESQAGQAARNAEWKMDYELKMTVSGEGGAL
jgi:hypothetical protein